MRSDLEESRAISERLNLRSRCTSGPSTVPTYPSTRVPKQPRSHIWATINRKWRNSVRSMKRKPKEKGNLNIETAVRKKVTIVCIFNSRRRIEPNKLLVSVSSRSRDPSYANDRTRIRPRYLEFLFFFFHVNCYDILCFGPGDYYHKNL